MEQDHVMVKGTGGDEGYSVSAKRAKKGDGKWHTAKQLADGSGKFVEVTANFSDDD